MRFQEPHALKTLFDPALIVVRHGFFLPGKTISGSKSFELFATFMFGSITFDNSLSASSDVFRLACLQQAGRARCRARCSFDIPPKYDKRLHY
jgi:hypothetical protein